MTAEDPELSQKERALGEIRSDIEITRERLAQTLDAIEAKLNVPKKAKRYANDLQEQFQKLLDERPYVIYAAAGSVVAAVGGLVAWRIARR